MSDPVRNGQNVNDNVVIIPLSIKTILRRGALAKPIRLLIIFFSATAPEDENAQ